MSNDNSATGVGTVGEPERFAPEMPGNRSLLVDDDADDIATEDDGTDAGDDEEAGDE